ncbi:DNA replication initiation control protein YabA [Granulicatella seriolae]|uniref:DNA replication initiation control protein YabA n=1 Tax=Granulicatella seriolae TaxID=2967226 RepID=A0ABT1WPD4_9LACT|nr:DNA replication initiation control protein YabA [Granulicatella seriolae]
MPNRQLYDRFQQLQSNMLKQMEALNSIEKEMQDLIQTNHNLVMENKHLKDKLDSMVEPQAEVLPSEAQEKKLSQSFLNLENIYFQGFHVCNADYGKRRNNDEECIFCTDKLYGHK